MRTAPAPRPEAVALETEPAAPPPNPPHPRRPDVAAPFGRVRGWGRGAGPGRVGPAGTAGPVPPRARPEATDRSMWKLGRNRVLLDETPEDEDGLPGEPQPAAAAQVQGTSFRGWKEVTSLFNKDDEQHLLERCKSPKSKGPNVRLREELKTEKKPGFWDNLVLKQNVQSKKPDEIEGWEPPKLEIEDGAAESSDGVNDPSSRPGWEEDRKASSKYTSLAGSGNSSRWGLRSAGKLVSIRRPSRGHLTENWEGLD